MKDLYSQSFERLMAETREAEDRHERIFGPIVRAACRIWRWSCVAFVAFHIAAEILLIYAWHVGLPPARPGDPTPGELAVVNAIFLVELAAISAFERRRKNRRTR
jgi:hypothetical protein